MKQSSLSTGTWGNTKPYVILTHIPTDTVVITNSGVSAHESKKLAWSDLEQLLTERNKMSERLTATEAAKISEKNDPIGIALNAILAQVQKCAEVGARALCVRDYGFGTGECSGSRETGSEFCQQIQDRLRGLGYRADLIVTERDTRLKVSW